MEHITIDHDEIREWAKKHGATPQLLDHPEAEADTVGLRLNFPGTADDTFLSASEVRKISWDEFFEIFEDEELAFVYNDTIHTPDYAYHFMKRSS